MKPQSIVALSLKDSELLALEATQKGQTVEVRNFGKFRIPDETDDKHFGREIKRVFRANGFGNKKMVFLSPDESVEHKILDLPSVSGAKLAAIVKRESLKDSRLAVSKDAQNIFHVREEIKDRGTTRKQVFSTTFLPSEVRKTLTSFSEAGLEPLYATSATAVLAQYSLANSPDIGDGYKALLHISDHHGQILIFDKNGWLFSREFNLISDFASDFPDESSSDTETPYEYEEGYESSDDEDRSESGGEDRTMLDLIVDEVNRSILYFKQSSRTMIDGILLCCDKETMSRLSERIPDELGINVRSLDSSELIDLSKLRSELTAEEFSLEAYLPLIALVAAPESPRCPNLVPPDFLERRQATAIKSVFAVAAAVLIFGAIAGYVALSYSNSTLRIRLEQKEDYFEKRAARFEMLKETMASRRAFEKENLIFQKASIPQPPWAKILDHVSAISPDDLLLTGMSAERKDDACWISVSGEARGQNPLDAQRCFRQFCDEWNRSLCFGQTTMEPIRLKIAEDNSTAPELESDKDSPNRDIYKVLFTMSSKVVENDEAS